MTVRTYRYVCMDMFLPRAPGAGRPFRGPRRGENPPAGSVLSTVAVLAKEVVIYGGS